MVFFLDLSNIDLISEFPMHDLLIIGGGPAGTAAGVYASRKQLKTLFITKDWGGQSTVSTDIQNWIGTPSISGDQLAKDLRGHLETYAGDQVDIISNQLVVSLNKTADGLLKRLSATAALTSARPY